jgi:hypothetical protein
VFRCIETVPTIHYIFNLSPTRYTIYSLFLSSFSSTCFGCYLLPSSGAQLQRTAIGFVSVENRGFSIKWCGGLFCVDLCVKPTCNGNMVHNHTNISNFFCSVLRYSLRRNPHLATAGCFRTRGSSRQTTTGKLMRSCKRKLRYSHSNLLFLSNPGGA